MKIILDGFGGDNAPIEMLKGAAEAVRELSVEVIITGELQTLQKAAIENEIPLDGITFEQADGVIEVCDDAADILKKKKNCSMAVALRLAKEGVGEAVVSAGSTAALYMGAIFIVKRQKNIKRGALAAVMPGLKEPFLLLDSGANVECRPEMLLEFAKMGSEYMRDVMGRKSPRVALCNVGIEPTKGRSTDLEAYKLLSEADINFIGNIEARDVPLSVCDVVVTDGFTGNVILKTAEGVATMLTTELKAALLSSTKGKIGALLIKNELRQFKAKLDYTEYGGAPILGVCCPVIKAHGSSNAKAIKNAIRQATLAAASYAKNANE